MAKGHFHKNAYGWGLYPSTKITKLSKQLNHTCYNNQLQQAIHTIKVMPSLLQEKNYTQTIKTIIPSF